MKKTLLPLLLIAALGAGCAGSVSDNGPQAAAPSPTPTVNAQEQNQLPPVGDDGDNDNDSADAGAQANVDMNAQMATSTDMSGNLMNADGTAHAIVQGTLTAGQDGVQTITVEGNNFSFSPNAFSVKKGQKVHVIFKNDNGFHDFKIDELGVNSGRIQGGNQTDVEFTADKAGTFQFYCSVGQHRAHGMWGTLTVTE